MKLLLIAATALPVAGADFAVAGTPGMPGTPVLLAQANPAAEPRQREGAPSGHAQPGARQRGAAPDQAPKRPSGHRSAPAERSRQPAQPHQTHPAAPAQHPAAAPKPPAAAPQHPVTAPKPPTAPAQHPATAPKPPATPQTSTPKPSTAPAQHPAAAPRAPSAPATAEPKHPAAPSRQPTASPTPPAGSHQRPTAQRPAPQQPNAQHPTEQQRARPRSPAAQQPNAAPQQPAAQNAQPQGPHSTRLEEFRRQRTETHENGRTVIHEPGRTIVREDGRAFIRHDEAERFRRNARDVRVEHRGNETVTVVVRPNRTQIVDTVDQRGRLLRRVRRDPNGHETVLIDNRGYERAGPRTFIVDVPPPVVHIPRDRYIVDADRADRALLYDTLVAPPVVRLERRYSLDQIRFNEAVRERMRRIDLDTITFDTGSWEIVPEEARRLEAVAAAIRQAVDRNPDEVFLIEGHTDAVGSDIDNLSLSDRRAEAVAEVLTQDFGIPPENLVTQGYGEQYLKVNTPGPEPRNRRVTVRRITPLLARGG